MTKERAKEILNTNHLNDLCNAGLEHIEQIGEKVEIGALCILEDNVDKQWFLIIDGFKKPNDDFISFYIMWLKGDKSEGDDWCSSGWYREFLYEATELKEALCLTGFKEAGK